MISVNALLQNIDDVSSLLKAGKLDPEKEYLVRIYTASLNSSEALLLSGQIKELLPRCSIFGATTVGLMFNDEIYEDATMAIFESFESASHCVRSFVHTDVSLADLAREISEFARSCSAKLMHMMFSHEFIKAHELVHEFNKINENTILVGGAAGVLSDKGINSYTFDENEIKPDSIICAALAGDELKAKSWVNIPHEPISEVFTLTEVERNTIKRVDGVDVRDWLAEYLGIDELRQYADYKTTAEEDELARFPLVLEGHSGASRLLYYDEYSDSVSQYFSELPEGTRFRIGYVSPKSIATSTYAICRELAVHPAESIFHYSCFFRRLYFGNCSEWEMSPYYGNGLCGVFLNGEIGNTGSSNECLCGSSVLVSVAENERFIEPDLSTFSEISVIDDKTQELLSFVLMKQKNILSEKNKALLNELTAHQGNLKDSLYYDPIIKIPNAIKYREDFEHKEFNKICVIKIENTLSIINRVNHKGYYSILRSFLVSIENDLKSEGLYDLLSYYAMNESTFLIASNSSVSIEKFRRTIQSIFNKYHLYFSDDREIVFVNRFIVVFGKDNLFESAISILRDQENKQMPLVVSNDTGIKEAEPDDEFAMLRILNYAIDSKRVVPYFQGIYNNETNCIDRYEALMRIKDQNNEVILPGKFLDIAKKYRLYNYLSEQMIIKVFDCINSQNVMVSLNISAFDIESDDIQSLIFKKLSECNDCSRLIFEIVESEYLSNLEQAKEFFDKVRSFGAKIAIDDFGSGYSSLREIIAIKPDYIKICGDVITAVCSDESNGTMVDMVFFLASSLDSELVAEYVENERIQSYVRKHAIGYSQGFFFSRPASFEETFPH